jgi:XRE family transcriptional regulator, regulator of sulfur utilization
MDVARRFGENLRRIRKGAGISQEELGYRCSLHRTEIGLLERGARVPRVDTLIKIASGLGVRIDCALLDGITWTPATMQAGSFELESRIDAAADIRESRRELEGRGRRGSGDDG